MKRPLAARHLARLHELVSTASICCVAAEKGLVDSLLIRSAADRDRSLAEEVVALAADRGWAIGASKSYAWNLMANFSDPVPRIRRVVDRDVFELTGMARDTDDDDVASLALQLLSDRRTLRSEIDAERPDAALPGAK